MPLIDSLMVTNNRHIDQAVDLLAEFSGKRIGFLGVTFKANTDDLRESPTLELMARLRLRGDSLAVYDPNLASGPHLDSQIAYVRHASPGQARLMDELAGMMMQTADDLVESCDVIVVSHATDEFRAAVTARSAHIHVLDLARLFKTIPEEATYQGIAW